MDPQALLTKLLADLKASDWLDSFVDACQLGAIAAAEVKLLFFSTSAAQHRAVMAAHPAITSMSDFTTHLEAHLEDAKAGAINWGNLAALLAQLVPLLISLFAKPAPVTP